ncbi:MAG: hypothetical protein ACFE68_05080 [Candidatus Hodarchaeota archaeon]
MEGGNRRREGKKEVNIDEELLEYMMERDDVLETSLIEDLGKALKIAQEALERAKELNADPSIIGNLSMLIKRLERLIKTYSKTSI